MLSLVAIYKFGNFRRYYNVWFKGTNVCRVSEFGNDRKQFYMFVEELQFV